MTSLKIVVGTVVFMLAMAAYQLIEMRRVSAQTRDPEASLSGFDAVVRDNSERMIKDGRAVFRFETFDDQTFWGDALRLHQAIEGAKFGGVGPGLSPRTALAIGLKVDVDALPASLIEQLRQGKVNLDDPAVTLALLKLNSVVGVTGFSNPEGGLKSVGIQCALCHSAVDNSLTQGIGHRLDGWANRDLNVGDLVSLAPNLQPLADLLGVDQTTVRKVLHRWGPGRFDAELALDGKAFRPDGKSSAVLIPPAFGLAGVNLHTWTGWGSVTYWNAFVANLEMHGRGTFFDPRMDNAAQFPVAARAGFGHVTNVPGLITPRLAGYIFTSWHCPPPCLLEAASTKMRPGGVTPSSTEAPGAPVAMFLLSIQNPDGTCTGRARSASTPCRPTVLRTEATAPRL
jgi:hypothetical protein